MNAELCDPALANAPCSHDTDVVTTTSLVSSILNWLRAGYPEGVPGPDRVPLLALLRATTRRPQNGSAPARENSSEH